jgi:hypothetical protein
MNRVRGVMMLLAACFAFWRGWKLHTGQMAIFAWALGGLALALGIWHLMRKPDRPRV